MYKNIGLIIALMFLGGCVSLIPKPYEMPSPDRLFIHNNPSVGDYAVYAATGAGMKIVHRYEVYGTTDTHVTVRYRMNYLDPGYKDLAPKEWYYRQINLDGQVLKAWAETDSGEYFNTPVAAPDSIGSLEYLTKIDQKLRNPLAIKAGQFEVDNINGYIYRVDAGLVNTNSSCLEYYSNDVPFRVLKREMVHSADVGAFLKSMESIKAAGELYFAGNYLTQYNKALKLYDKTTQNRMEYQSTVELVEYGYAK